MDSSIWDESDIVVKVFLTMMALKDEDHIVRLSAYQISRRAKKTECEVLDALRVLSSPDSKRLEAQEFDGRRIQMVDEGWLVLNGEKYRELVKLEMIRARNRRGQKAYRERKKMLEKMPVNPQAVPKEYQRQCDEGKDPDANDF